MAEGSESQPQQSEGISRRNALKILSGALVSAALRSDSAKPSEYFPDHMEALPEMPRKLVIPESPPPFSRQYIGEVIRELQQPRGSKEERSKSLQRSLAIVRTNEDNPDKKTAATVLQIDESGVYLTARHTVVDSDGLLQKPIINNPFTGEVNPVRQVLAHKTADLALVYAPTGKDPKPTPGLEISMTPMTNHQDLKIVGIWPPKNRLFIDAGTIDDTHSAKTWRGVKKMIPFGGTSGSPIANEEERVSAVLSGFYGTGYAMGDYQGSRVTPLSYLDSLLADPDVFSAPA